MKSRFTTKRKIISVISVALFVFLSTASIFLLQGVPNTYASAARSALKAVEIGAESSAVNPLAPETIGAAAGEATETLSSDVILPMLGYFGMMIALNGLQLILDKVAYDSAVWVASGGTAEQPLIWNQPPDKAFKEFRDDFLGEALGTLNEELEDIDFGFDLCAPPDPLILLNIALGVRGVYDPPKPKCDIRKVASNWENAAMSIYNKGKAMSDDPGKFVLNEFTKMLRPGQNEISATIGINTKIFGQELKTSNALFEDAVSSNWFKPVSDIVTGERKTPSSVVEGHLKSSIESSERDKKTTYYTMLANAGEEAVLEILLNSAGMFVNTMLSELIKNVMSGMFFSQPPKYLDFETTTTGDRRAAEERYSGILKSTPFTTSNYNVLSEFSICPVGEYIKRGLNHCVMDPNFATAVVRSLSGTALTVQEAIDQGLLNGSWPLISFQDTTDNQDPLCFQRGYCYGNLVKLRKARVIPIGWELAAGFSIRGSRITLQQAIDNFSNCNEQGMADETHKWCHLIDPNWVLRYPPTQCKAYVNSELIPASSGTTRMSECANVVSCVDEDNMGNCRGAYGYCVREKNTWRFPGQECPAEFAGCMAFTNTHSQENRDYIFNTVEAGICNSTNAGCRWYAQEKPVVDATTGARAYQEDGARVYLNYNAPACGKEDAGCTQLNKMDTGYGFNMIANPSFSEASATVNTPTFWGWANTGGRTPGVFSDGAVEIGSSSFLNNISVKITPRSFYTFSMDAQAVSGSANIYTYIIFNSFDEEGNWFSPDLRGVTVKGDCALNNEYYSGESISVIEITKTVDTSSQRIFCTFSAPEASSLLITLGSAGGTVRYDNIQLEVGENATLFTEGYLGAPKNEYLKVPPAELNCRGLASDHPDCASYAKICTASEVGCQIYTPVDGDPVVPAVVSANDMCPNACVGYSSYKQLPTPYDTEDQLFYFIADKSTSCSGQYVGCDSFTNLDKLALGGESVEYYSDMRSCLNEELSGDRAKTYYTWEGSDNAGYQLKTWRLLKSNLDTAPCTTKQVTSVAGVITLECNESSAYSAPDACNEHSDIFTNPDCREFYDEDGAITYRLFSNTITIDNECHPYRKTMSNKTDCEGTGGLWVEAGECRYFGLQKESKMCPAQAAGCREYVGAAGRNVITMVDATFEDQTTGAFEAFNQGAGGATINPSNESISAGGHSLRVEAVGAGSGIATKANTISYFISPGDTKLYQLEFWAKGSGPINAYLQSDGQVYQFAEAQQLDGAWKAFKFGPIDANALGSDTVLKITAPNAGTLFYIDNLRLKQTEQVITLVKNSWVVDEVCDSTPTGIPAPQYYLGCEEYINSKGKTQSIFQFSQLCSEDKVGCEMLFDTHNSASPYPELYNARCYAHTEDGLSLSGDWSYSEAGDYVTDSPHECKNGSETLCTIPVGQNYCMFSIKYDALLLPLYIKTDVETVRIPNDNPVYLVNNSQGQCSSSAVGCEEVGKPVYAQDKNSITSYEDTYIINNPDKYLNDDGTYNTLCTHEALFCEEWATTLDGLVYFKDPVSKTCDWKTGVNVQNRVFDGWFRKGTNEPCYWTDIDPEDVQGYNRGVDNAFIIDGNKFAIWRNGDEAFDGWAGECARRYDLCTEFVDTTENERYNFINNETLRSEERLQNTTLCQGQVSRKEGCAVFDNAGYATKTMSASPSYIASRHSDVLFGDSPFSLELPIDCSDVNRSTIEAPSGENINLCVMRCRYFTMPHDPPRAVFGLSVDKEDGIDNKYYGSSCLYNSDCPTIETISGESVTGICELLEETNKNKFVNDANTVLKVDRSRECAEWLMCSSSHSSWDTNHGEYVNICES
ncbi:MAG: hypothetical protein ABIH21_01160, partial [Patescibacteria group bacterium]